MEPEKDIWKILKSESPADGFERRVIRRVEEGRSMRIRIRWWAAASSALAAAGILLALILINPRRASQPEPQATVATEDAETEEAIEQILNDPDIYSDALIDGVFQEDNEDAGDEERSFEVNPEAFTYC